MRKKCVRWAKPVLAALTAIIVVGFQWSNNALSAEATDPLTLPRLAFADLSYVGGFRLPSTGTGGHFGYGGTVMAYNPARNSLFINSFTGKVAEVEIPTPFKTTDVTQMPFTKYLQNFYDPTDGHFHELATSDANLAGLMVHGDRLYGTGSVYYDASNSQRVSHFSHSTNLAQSSFIGMSQVWETGKTGYVAGYLANIPSEWQPLLGGPALTGQCCIPIVTRTSFGPAAFAWDPSSIGRYTAVGATPLLYYTETHATLGPWEGANEWYGGTAKMGGVAVIAGTRTALFIGRNGLGTFCYGHGVSDPALAGKLAADGEINCYDPTNSYKGQHAYPYRYQIWAYDLADFAAVKAGSKQPWEVVPYAVWPFELPTAAPPGIEIRIGGVAYDAQRQLLYINQYQADQDGYSYRPIVHTLRINVPTSTTPAPPSTEVSLTPDVAAPQPPGALIRWSAVATGDQGPYEYKWTSYANGAWSVLQDWSTSQTFDWQPTVAASDARMAVSVRQASSDSLTAAISADSIAATAEYPFAIVDSTTETSPPVSAVTLSSSLAAPQPVSSSIVWTATAAGGDGALVYQWFISADGGASWTPTGPYAPSNQFTWTPTAVNANYRIAVWVTHAGKTTGDPEAEAKSATFAITEPVAARLSSVALVSNVASPQPVSSTIVWTATATGGTGPLAYMWFISNDGGVSWTPTGPYAASNQLTWTPTAVNANYRVAVWAKHAANTSGEPEAEAKTPAFAITEPVPVSSVALTSNVASPQAVSSTIVWTATPSGGTGPLVYLWFISNDGGASWTQTGPYASSNQLTWTPTAVNANYRVAVWVKRAANPGGDPEAEAKSGTFAIIEPSKPVASVALTSNLAAPQPVSTSIVWTATPTGGTGPLVYLWFISNNGGASWDAMGSYGPSNQFTWTPTAANANYRVAVWVKRASNPSGDPEAEAKSGTFAIIEPSKPVASVTLASNLASPQPLSSTVTWTATPTGGTGALVYLWFISNNGGASWDAMGSYGPSNQFTWTPAAANANYRVAVWVKRASNPSGDPEAEAKSGTFTISDVSKPVSSVTLASNLASPQPVSSAITWTATPTGGTGALVYLWFISNDGGATWTQMSSYGPSNTFTWTPSAANASYRIAVWVKHEGNASGDPEAEAKTAPFAIIGGQ